MDMNSSAKLYAIGEIKPNPGWTNNEGHAGAPYSPFEFVKEFSSAFRGMVSIFGMVKISKRTFHWPKSDLNWCCRQQAYFWTIKIPGGR